MPSLSKIASTTLALTTVLLRGTAAAAIQGGQLEFCDFGLEANTSPSAAAKRQADPDSIVFPDSPILQKKPSAAAPQKTADPGSITFPGPTNADPPESAAPPAAAPAVDDGRELKVGVYMHITGKPEDTTSPEFFLSREDLDRQVTAMNEFYTPANISFHLLDADWTREILLGSSRGLKTDLAHSLHKGNLTTLNIFWIDTDDVGYGGTSNTFKRTGDNLSDGIIVNARSVPGGSHPTFNLGVTAVHEAGHWFSLEHTALVHKGDCEPDGKTRCGQRCDSNFMSYGDDACLTEFTPKQIKKMRDFAINKRGL